MLVSEGGARTPLTPNDETYSTCTERFGKVRVFLRAHGWRPADEQVDVFREEAAALWRRCAHARGGDLTLQSIGGELVDLVRELMEGLTTRGA